MEDEIEETHRQLRHSAALIQDAFEGLSTLNSQDSQHAGSAQVHEPGEPASPRSPHRGLHPSLDTPSTPTTPSGQHEPNSMDPGHDVIVISSEVPSVPSVSSPLPPLPPSASHRRGRSSDSTLSTLRAELLASTQNVRERATELDDLRRAIAQYAEERQRLLTSRRSSSPPHASAAATPAARDDRRTGQSTPNADRRQRAPSYALGSDPYLTQAVSTMQSRQALLNDSLRSQFDQAEAEGATFHGMMVAARTAASQHPPTSGSIVESSASSASTANSQAGAPLPTVITSRVTRLALEIQQDISRISQQTESLMAWISRTRAEAALSRASAFDHSSALDSANTTAAARGESTTYPRSLGRTLSSWTPPPLPRTARTTLSQQDEDSIIPSEAFASTSAPHAPRPRPRVSQDGGTPRPRYIRSGPSVGDSPNSSGTEIGDAYRLPSEQSSFDFVQDLLASRGRVLRERALRGDLENGQHDRRWVAEDAWVALNGRADAGGSTRTRSYRVRHRSNTDGDATTEHTTLRPRPEASLGFGEAASVEMREDVEDDEDGGEDIAWVHALSRLDQMSRQSSARLEATRRQHNEEGSSVVPRGPPRAPGVNRATMGTTRRANVVPVWCKSLAESSLGGPYSSLYYSTARLVPRSGHISAGEDDYERDMAAMRARAQSLISSMATSRSLGGVALPPPPPTTRPLTFVPTTQGTPGSLWNDSNPRVRLRADISRAFDRARDYVPRPPSPPASGLGADDRRRTPPAEREPERAMWGSPVPFHPSPLPLPRVEDIGGLEARSRAFSGPKTVARLPRKRGFTQAGC
ncbi:uncharacterized protein BXZ73DRAFT_78517 [Epithele typhae]|uniref:uncharacterized protein n=1 Tax=Epithele typhae TaxID=378194 RepID=UPI002007DEDC|nr:uncharacterized protein BXZ73DRAFT_78517 [Epithele typhae]KAH9927477.1 hypothetical protein BXZ73DRAFT_78517 [Epithele typhae]